MLIRRWDNGESMACRYPCVCVCVCVILFHLVMQNGRVVRLKQSCSSAAGGGGKGKPEEGEGPEEHSRSVPHFERERDRARRLVSSILLVGRGGGRGLSSSVAAVGMECV